MTETSRQRWAIRLQRSSLPDADGNTVKLSDFKGRKVVVYFYPAASTPDAPNRPANSGTASHRSMTRESTSSVSPDKPDKACRIPRCQSLTFPLLSDPDKGTHGWGAFGEKSSMERQCRALSGRRSSSTKPARSR